MHRRLHGQPGKLSLPCFPSRSASRSALRLQRQQHRFFHDASSLPSGAGGVIGAGWACRVPTGCHLLIPGRPDPCADAHCLPSRCLGRGLAGGKVLPPPCFRIICPGKALIRAVGKCGPGASSSAPPNLQVPLCKMGFLLEPHTICHENQG